MSLGQSFCSNRDTHDSPALGSGQRRPLPGHPHGARQVGKTWPSDLRSCLCGSEDRGSRASTRTLSISSEAGELSSRRSAAAPRVPRCAVHICGRGGGLCSSLGTATSCVARPSPRHRRRLDLAPLTCAEGRGRAARVAAGGYAAATPTRSPKPREGTKPTCAYVERIASAGVAADPIFTRRLLTMLAHQREPLNTTALANALSRPGGGSTIDAFTDLRCGSSPTSTMWASASRSARSSATRARHLLNISTREQLHSHPMRGATETPSSDLIRRSLSAPHAAALADGGCRDRSDPRPSDLPRRRRVKAGMLTLGMRDTSATRLTDLGLASLPDRPRRERSTHGSRRAWAIR